MDYGNLASYFDSFASKTLAQVDINRTASNQHEFNGVSQLRAMFGDADIKHMPTIFVYLTDDEDPVFDRGFTTWYDARRNNLTRTEYRLYYSTNAAMELASAGDLMVVANADNHDLLIIFAKDKSTISMQVRWLFGLSDNNEKSFTLGADFQRRINAIAAEILEQIGIEVGIPNAADLYLDNLIDRFGSTFPESKVFSEYSMGTLPDLDWKHEPDKSLIDCFNREELLFRVFERHLLEDELSPYLQNPIDIDGILRTTMSVFQRRRSRAGTAFENQLAALFKARHIRFSCQKYTEGKSKPDFIFPSIEEYHDPSFPSSRLTMLGAKTTAKERWRQWLEEADRISPKHGITLEPAISEDYTNAMRQSGIQLVVPEPLFETYTPAQKKWLMTVQQFCAMVEERQTDI